MTKDYKTQGTDLKLCQQPIEAAAEEEDSAQKHPWHSAQYIKTYCVYKVEVLS